MGYMVTLDMINILGLNLFAYSCNYLSLKKLQRRQHKTCSGSKRENNASHEYQRILLFQQKKKRNRAGQTVQ